MEIIEATVLSLRDRPALQGSGGRVERGGGSCSTVGVRFLEGFFQTEVDAVAVLPEAHVHSEVDPLGLVEQET